MTAPTTSPAGRLLQNAGSSHAAGSDGRRFLWSGHAWLSGAILLAALIWRLVGLTRNEVWRDEAISLIHMRAGWRELLQRLPAVEDSPPLGFLLLKAWLLLHDSELMARMLSVLLGVAAVGVLMVLARRFADRGWWVTGVLTAFSYQTLFFSQEIRVYAAFFLTTALCLATAERVAQQPRARSILLMVLLAGLSAHLHVAGQLIFPMIMIYLVVRGGWQAIRPILLSWPVWLWAAIVLPIVWFSRDWTSFHQAQGVWVVPPLEADHVMEVIRRFIGLRTLRWWAAGEVMRLNPWAGFAMERIVLAGVILLPAAGLLDGRTRRVAAGLIAASLSYVALLIVASLLTIPCFLDRTVLPAWCPWLLAMGLGAATGIRRAGRLAAQTLGAATALVWAATWVWLATVGPPRQPPSIAAFEWMRARLGPHDLIFSLNNMVEDLVVYRLGDCIDATQLLSPNIRIYDGRPPRHLLRRPERDPAHIDRLRAAITERLLTGVPYRIWFVYKGVLPQPAPPGSAQELIEQTHEPVGRFTNTELRAVHICVYAPLPTTYPSP